MILNDKNIFKRKLEVETFECDMMGRMKLSAVLRQMQEIGNLHLEEVGYSYEKLRELGMAFLASKIYIKVNRMPNEREQIIQVTAPKKTKGIYFFRDIDFYDTEGNLLIETHAALILVSAAGDKHTVLRPKEFDFPFECDDNTDYSISSWKANIPNENITEDYRKIRYSDIDCNRHMNNAVYADIVYDFMPIEAAKNKEIDEFRIFFKNEAFLGETIKIESCMYDDQKTFGIKGLRDNDEDKRKNLCFEATVHYK